MEFESIIGLLKSMISIPSLSKEESASADFLESWMKGNGLHPERKKNNLWLSSFKEDDGRPVILLNAHIDTVKPSSGYSRDPFVPFEDEGRIFGLGSNDDGGSLVALLSAYLDLTSRPQPYRLIFSATAEEEISGKNGIECIFPEIGKIDFGVIGEPTCMRMAVAEKGLMVLDCKSYGKSGHAARNEGINAIYEALPSVNWFRTHRFEKESPFLGPVRMTVTQINSGIQHNVIPDVCSFVVDIRPNGMYTNTGLLAEIKKSVDCEVNARSTRLGSSHLDSSHPFVRKGTSLGLESFGSPTTSNQALSPFPTVKIGPGDSARSHSADEYIVIDEIKKGVEIFVKLLDGLKIDRI
jgi:acetylornithine deacetylase